MGNKRNISFADPFFLLQAHSVFITIITLILAKHSYTWCSDKSVITQGHHLHHIKVSCLGTNDYKKKALFTPPTRLKDVFVLDIGVNWVANAFLICAHLRFEGLCVCVCVSAHRLEVCWHTENVFLGTSSHTYQESTKEILLWNLSFNRFTNDSLIHGMKASLHVEALQVNPRNRWYYEN